MQTKDQFQNPPQCRYPNLHYNQPMMQPNHINIHQKYQQTQPNFGYVMATNKLQNMNCIINESQSLGGLYLGDIISTMKESLLNRHKIKAILSCVTESTKIIKNPYIEFYKRVTTEDIQNDPIDHYFAQCNQFIHQMRQQHYNVLVHCHAGISRSSTIVCAYLMNLQRYQPQQALNVVRSRRKRANPNQHFLKLLHRYYDNFINNHFQDYQIHKQILNNSINKHLKPQINNHKIVSNCASQANFKLNQYQQKCPQVLEKIENHKKNIIPSNSCNQEAVQPTILKKRGRIPWKSKSQIDSNFIENNSLQKYNYISKSNININSQQNYLKKYKTNEKSSYTVENSNQTYGIRSQIINRTKMPEKISYEYILPENYTITQEKSSIVETPPKETYKKYSRKANNEFMTPPQVLQWYPPYDDQINKLLSKC